MRIETIINIAIPSLVAIWVGSLTIRAMASEEPSQYDPQTKLKQTARFLKTFIRRFLVPLLIFAVSLHFVVANLSIPLVAVIMLNLSISWLLVIAYRDKTLKHVIYLMDRVDELNTEISALKQFMSKTEQGDPSPKGLLNI